MTLTRYIHETFECAEEDGSVCHMRESRDGDLVSYAAVSQRITELERRSAEADMLIATLTAERDAAIELVLFQANQASKAQTQVDRVLKDTAQLRADHLATCEKARESDEQLYIANVTRLEEENERWLRECQEERDAHAETARKLEAIKDQRNVSVIDHDFTRNIVCPYCGVPAVVRLAWETLAP